MPNRPVRANAISLSRLMHRAHAEARASRRPRMSYRERFRSALRRAWRDARIEARDSPNLRRRHLSESQRAMVAAKLAQLGEGRPSKTAPIGAVSQDAAGEMLNVGRRTVQRARDVIDDAVPELASAVERGDVSGSAAADVARQQLDLPPRPG